MRINLHITAILISTIYATAAFADEFPPRKPGLWEVTSAGEKRPTVKMKMCIDKDTDEQFHKFGTDLLTEKTCSRRDLKVTDNVATAETQCKIGGSTVTTTSVTTFTGDTAFHGDSKIHSEPALLGKTDAVSTEDGKWIGPCPSDMEPGDFVLANGPTLNIKMLNALKKWLPK
ncbi:MAG: DUF3617 domain-containing protein [Beijerinckiaceae bacterium]